MKQGWETKKLSELCNLITKGTTPTSIGYKFTDEGINFIKVESLTESGEIIPNKVAYIDEDCHKAMKRSQLKTNDILFSIAGALGRIGIVRDEIVPANTNQALAIIRLKSDSGVLVNYLAKYFNSNLITDEIEKLRGGAAQQNLSLTQLNELQIPLPPLPEQQRIVAILDEAFAAIAKAKANAEQNLKNAKELFESYLQGVFENKGEGWEEKTLDEIIESNVIGLTKNSTEQRSDYQYKYVKMNNITRDNRFDLTKFTCVNATKLEVEKYSLSSGDFLFNTRNSYELVGKTCLFEGYDEDEILYNNNIMRIRFIQNINPHFINYSFTTADVVKKLDALKSGTTNVSAIYYKDLKNLILKIPPLKEQQTIIQKLDALSAETKKLESIYQQKINDLEELKTSILQKAFSGELKTDKINQQ